MITYGSITSKPESLAVITTSDSTEITRPYIFDTVSPDDDWKVITGPHWTAEVGKRSNYKILHKDERVLLLKDVGPWDTYLTITNDAERVVSEILAMEDLGNRRLEYIDSEGDRIRILIKDGKFDRFAEAGERPGEAWMKVEEDNDWF